MNRPTGTTDPNLQSLITSLKQTSSKNKAKIWEDVARILSFQSRRKVVTNLSTVNRVTKKDEVVVIPGKLLGNGSLEHPVTISAWAASTSAKTKVTSAGGVFLPLPQLLKTNPKGQNVRIIR